MDVTSIFEDMDFYKAAVFLSIISIGLAIGWYAVGSIVISSGVDENITRPMVAAASLTSIVPILGGAFILIGILYIYVLKEV